MYAALKAARPQSRQHGGDLAGTRASSSSRRSQKLGPDASAEQMQDYIANLTDFAGIDGIYDFKANPERGLGPDSSIVTRYDAKDEGVGVADEAGRRAAEIARAGGGGEGNGRRPTACVHPHSQ